ncbi:MAG: hypothetical protein KAT68_10075 [Bacteroidales bacterium]|nr:hypothetical protein [Bacteroidales bacterium]
MKKRNIYFSLGIVFVLLVTILIFFVYKINKKEKTDAEIQKYISYYTSGIISKKSTVQVIFVNDIVEPEDLNKIIDKKIFHFKPKINGTSYWINENTLEFKPEKDLPSNTKYIATLEINKLIRIDNGLTDFKFEFQTIKQDFEVKIGEIITIDKNTLKWQKITGHIYTADFEDVENISEILKAKIDDKEIEINWKQNIESKEHYFEIDSIERKETQTIVTVEWNGKSIGVDKKDKIIIEIPALGDFKFISAKVIHQPEQYLKLNFSDPILENQELEGLIRIGNIKKIKYIIEDNTIKLYPPKRLKGNYTININEGIRNILGYKFKETISIDVLFEKIKPAVRLVNKGVILPSSENGLVLPFESVNLSAVDVRIIKIFENNVTQFLQINNYEGKYELRRVGLPVIQTTIKLSGTHIVDFGRWNRFTLDLNELIDAEPGAIYNIKIGFRKQYSLYSCDDDDDDSEDSDNNDSELSETNWQNPDDESESSYWDCFDNYYYGDYDWRNRDDPCHDAYFGSRRAVSQNILATNLGLIAKKGNNDTLYVIVSDIRTTKPLKDVTIEAYNYQRQVLGSIKTDNSGIAKLTNSSDVYFIVAKLNKERAFLKLNDGTSLSLSCFDISGDAVSKGLKGFIFGERGVWRPGDSLFVSFILEENSSLLPINHPIIFELKNPLNQLVKKIIQQKNTSNFYTFRIKTENDAPTGNWEAKIKVGGVTFAKQLKIETIKPNRLKINFNFDKDYLIKDVYSSALMKVKWLHGAIAKNLNARVEVLLSPVKTSFKKYSDFTFDDPTKRFYSESDIIFDGTLNENGEAEIKSKISTDKSASGKLKAIFVTKVFEQSGNFSIDQYSIPYHPYSSYVGLKLPKGDKARGMLLTDTTHVIEVVTLDTDGNLISKSHPIEMKFYKIDWKWWWDKSSEDLVNFTNRSYVSLLKEETIYTKQGKAKWNIKINYPNWGRYLVRTYDKVSGHSSAKIVYIDWPGWAGRAQKDQTGGVTMLTFTSDKDKYLIGENINLNIPSGKGGRVLISLESGTRVIDSYWLETQEDETSFSIKAAKSMCPNIYVNITMLQPHAQTVNDLPIRLYGIIPISVEDTESHLKPVLIMPDVLESETNVKITVKESDNKEMTYIIAIVDEGLLDLTRFKTPDPWKKFNAKEALGVKTWDIYDYVIGAFGGELERLLSIGGGDEIQKPTTKKAERFKPMVKFIGPYHLKEGGKQNHNVKIPRYIGSVRTMLIARNEKAYGITEKTTPVKKPLMVVGTLPRVLGPGEIVKLPVNVFVMDKKINEVKIEIKTNSILKIIGNNEKYLKFKDEGEKFIEFDLKAKSELGIAKVEIIATSGREKAIYDIELDVRNPNPRVTDVLSKVIGAGEEWKTSFTPIGMKGTNKGIIEISTIPSFNLEKRLKFLINFPHGCVEQTTSAVFPQLYLDKLIELETDKKKHIEKNIKTGINKLINFQLYNGGLSYWPNGSSVSEWGTNYAGHFMLEAQNKGYTVPQGFIKKWRKYQRKKAVNWVDDGHRSQLIQAYRLYTLALADNPEIGAMNRLKEMSNLSLEAKWRLAAAYQIIGKQKVAKNLIKNLTTDVDEYNEMSFTYGSALRDKALILETLVSLNEKEMAFDLLTKLAEYLNTNQWYSTQTTAFCLIAISKYLEKENVSDHIYYIYQINNGKEIEIKSNALISQTEIKITFTLDQILDIKNKGKGIIFAKLILSGIPEIGEKTDAENHLKIDVIYSDINGNIFDPVKIQQGTDFVAEVSITHPGIKDNYSQMALTQIFPSGWEIINTRMINDEGMYEHGISIPTYQDIRDDRVYTYFDINKRKTKKFRILLNASYLGKYYLPTIYVEAMYDATINARKHGQWIKVVKQE